MGDSARACLLQCLNCAHFFLFGHNHNLQHHWSDPVVYLSGAFCVCVCVICKPAICEGNAGCAGFRVTTKEARSPRLSFVRRLRPLQSFFLQPVSRLALHVMENHVRGGEKKSPAVFLPPSETLALLSCHGGWWLIADKALQACKRQDVLADWL